jgi:hypothetical protein
MIQFGRRINSIWSQKRRFGRDCFCYFKKAFADVFQSASVDESSVLNKEEEQREGRHKEQERHDETSAVPGKRGHN